MPKPDLFYRVGRSQPRNIYVVTPDCPEGIYIGVFFSEGDAAVAVRALNMRQEGLYVARAREASEHPH